MQLGVISIGPTIKPKVDFKMFSAVKTNRVYQEVVDQVQDAILNGELVPGEKLPPERELKEQFGISRGALREALRVLEQKGLIDIQLGAGGGAIVREITAELITDSLSLLLRNHQVPLDHLQEFRMDIEGSIARLAAERAVEGDVAKLREILVSAEACLVQALGWEAYVDADAQLHMALAGITGNTVYTFIQRAIHENINTYYAEFLERDAGELRRHYKDLCALVDAIADANGDMAYRIMQRHLSRLGK